MTKLKAYNDQVILKPVVREQNSRIFIPDMGNEKPILAEVVTVSRGIYNYHTDKIIDHELKVGDIVYIPKMGAQVIELDRQEYYVCQAGQILAGVIEEN